MALSPEQKLAAVRTTLMLIRKNPGVVATPAELFNDTVLTDSMRKDVGKKLTAAGFIRKAGAGRSTRYIFLDTDAVVLRDELDDLIDDAEALSAFLWPRFEGHLGSAAPDEEGEIEDALLAAEASDDDEEVDPQTALLRSIATNLAGLTELVAAVFTTVKEGGGTANFDLTPFVRSYTSLTERVASMEKKIITIQEGMGLSNGTEEEPRGTDRGLQDTSADDREGESRS